MKRGEIYLTKLDKSGNVQQGFRPVVVVQNDVGNHFSPTTIVCSITSMLKPELPTHIAIGTSGGLIKDSMIQCEQIFTVNKSDLRHYVGMLSDSDILNKLDKALLISLGLKGEK